MDGDVTARDNANRGRRSGSGEEMDEGDAYESRLLAHLCPAAAQGPAGHQGMLAVASTAREGSSHGRSSARPRRGRSLLVTVTVSKESLPQFARVARTLVWAATQQAAITDETEQA